MNAHAADRQGRLRPRRTSAILVALTLLAGACSGGDDAADTNVIGDRTTTTASGIERGDETAAGSNDGEASADAGTTESGAGTDERNAATTDAATTAADATETSAALSAASTANADLDDVAVGDGDDAAAITADDATSSTDAGATSAGETDTTSTDDADTSTTETTATTDTTAATTTTERSDDGEAESTTTTSTTSTTSTTTTTTSTTTTTTAAPTTTVVPTTTTAPTTTTTTAATLSGPTTAEDEAAIRTVFSTLVDTSLPFDAKVHTLENAQAVRAQHDNFISTVSLYGTADLPMRTLSVNGDRADFTFDVFLNDLPLQSGLSGQAVRQGNGDWVVTQQSFCNAIGLVPGLSC